MFTANYDITQIISEYTTEEAANAAKTRTARQYPELAARLGVEDTTDPWLHRESWGVTLKNAPNAECAQVWDYLNR